MSIEPTSSRLYQKDKHFREFSVWPIYTDFNTDEWLSNFNSAEIEVAERLLTNFTYFNEGMTDSLIKAAIVNYFTFEGQSRPEPPLALRRYIATTAFVLCEGERPHPTDSGHLFARKLRDRLHIPEPNILLPQAALLSRARFERFVFIDDFAGSGNQFRDTWRRLHHIDGAEFSFEAFSSLPTTTAQFVYCSCINSARARANIGAVAPVVKLFPAHQLEDHHSAVSLTSRIWEGMDAPGAIQRVKQASARAGYTEENFGENDWRGFHALGLTLAFNHGIPDASLPLFYSNRNGWKPLIVRR